MSTKSIILSVILFFSIGFVHADNGDIVVSTRSISLFLLHSEYFPYDDGSYKMSTETKSGYVNISAFGTSDPNYNILNTRLQYVNTSFFLIEFSSLTTAQVSAMQVLASSGAAVLLCKTSIRILQNAMSGVQYMETPLYGFSHALQEFLFNVNKSSGS